MTETPAFKHPASFRDPSGFVFEKDGKIFRHVTKKYSRHYKHFIQSGLYDLLTKESSLIEHKEVKQDFWNDPEWYTTLEYQKIQFISYPYEWSFDALKDAAQLTLDIAIKSIKYNVMLKDATPFNVQFINGRPVFIDTLSFEIYEQGTSWIAYHQFIESFAAPLLLMKHFGLSAHGINKNFPEGIPVSLLSKLLPLKTKFNLNTWMHVHLHSSISKKKIEQPSTKKLSKQKLTPLFHNLRSWITHIKVNKTETQWSNYYEQNILSKDYLLSKEKIVSEWLPSISSQTVLDLGANDGHFSRLAAKNSSLVIACDSDPLCINNLYNEIKGNTSENILPLIIDIVNPSPAIGWNNEERHAFLQRCKVDLLMCLALIHHLALGKNVQLKMIAHLFSRLCDKLIIEFVPKEDKKAKLLLQNRADIFDQYSKELFELNFAEYFTVLKEKNISGSGRTLYLMQNRNGIF